MRSRMVAVVAAAGLVAGSLAACGEDDGARKALGAFATAWEKGDISAVPLADTLGAPLAGAAAQQQLTAFAGDLGKRWPKVKVPKKLNAKDTNATGVVTVEWPVTDSATWSYPVTVRIRKIKDTWRVYFGPKTVHPDLTDGAKFTLKRINPTRGPIVDSAGQPIVTNRDVMVVGVEPQRVPDPAVLVASLKAIFAEINVDVDVDAVPARMRSAKKDAFVEVVTLRMEDYQAVENDLQQLQGTRFRRGNLPLGPSPQFARALLGGVGDVTKEILDKNPGKYVVGEKVGLGGLQGRYEDRLRGIPGATVVLTQADNKPGKDMFTGEPVAGPAVKVSLDPKLQQAADKALAGETRKSAMVVIRVSDGAIVAVANGPKGANFNLAFNAQVPPGSTFKAISALGLLANGSVTIDTPVDCPATLNVGGREFKNAHDMALGPVPFRVDFAKSCNTAFAGLAPKLGADGLAKAGSSVGIGVPWDLGTDAFTGKVSTGGSPIERAAAAFGQGTTIVSPVVMAAAAAAIARGQWKQPVLVLDPAPAKPAPDGAAISPQVLEALRTMMREVVTAGTASSLAGLPGAPLHGKTGTAEFDSKDPNRTHSWFMGWKGDLAFATFVENGGDSTAAAVPLSGSFFLGAGV